MSFFNDTLWTLTQRERKSMRERENHHNSFSFYHFTNMINIHSPFNLKLRSSYLGTKKHPSLTIGIHKYISKILEHIRTMKSPLQSYKSFSRAFETLVPRHSLEITATRPSHFKVYSLFTYLLLIFILIFEILYFT